METPSVNPILDPSGAREQIDAWRGRIEQLAADTRAMSDEFTQMTATAEDAGGMVRVTVDSSGALTDLWLGPRAQRVPPDTLARTIMGAVTKARAGLAERAQQVITTHLGAESGPGQMIAERVANQLRPTGQGPTQTTPEA